MEETKKSETENKQEENKITAAVEAQASETQETQEQINWKRFREAREVERKQKIEAEKRAAEKEAEAEALKSALEAIVNKPSQSNSHQINDSIQESDEERLKRLIAESLEAQRKKDQIERAQREQEQLPQRLTESYSDFNKVCTTENLDYLEYHYPEIARAFKHMPDTFQKWSDVYQAVKRLIPNPESKKDQSKAEKNLNKPQAMSIAGKTQTGDNAPQYLDDKRKSDNWARMQKTMRGGG